MSVEVDRFATGVAVLTLDDPERRNAMTVAMGEALSDRCQELASDPDLRAVVLTGRPPAFSAGGDLAMLEDLAARTRDDGFDAAETMYAFYRRFLSIRELPVPVLAAINGHAIGAGLCLALACDLRIVAQDAKVGLNFAQLGLHPGMGGSWFLPRILGEQRAAAWLYTGAILDGTRAAAEGLALEARPADQVLDATLELAETIAAASPVVVRQLRETLDDDLPLDAALRREATCQATNYATDDLAEGLAAARDRRSPRFPGR